MADISSLSSEDPRKLGRYKLLGRLGEGGQGVVFLASDPSSGAQVAVKLMRAHFGQDDASRSRFLREVAAAKRVARFCTAQVLDADLAGSQPYIVSEYIPGPSLAAVVRSDGPRGGTALERIAVNTANALAGIHQANIIHRDFKAANVLLGPDGPVVIDFGIAKALDTVESKLTLTGHSAGTPAYMAPEQFGNGPLGPPVDMFAWGVTMAFAATGELPFGSGKIPALIYRILNEPPRLDGLTAPLRGLVAACLEKDPAARPTAREIVDRLLEGDRLSDAAELASAPANPGARPAAGAAAPKDVPPPFDGDPVKAPRMARRAPSRSIHDAAPPIAAAEPRRSRQALAWTAAAVVLAAFAGGAITLKEFNGLSSTGKSSLPPVGAAALHSTSAAVVSPAVSPTKRRKKRTARRRTHSSSAAAAPTKSASAFPTPSASPKSTASPTPSASPNPTVSPTATASSAPNPYTPTEVCGSGYGVIDSHALAEGTIYLLYDSATGKNCVTTMRSAISGKITMVATLKVEGGPSASDSGNYTYYAGPVALGAAATCVEWGGAIGNSSWMSSWSHCG